MLQELAENIYFTYSAPIYFNFFSLALFETSLTANEMKHASFTEWFVQSV